MSNAELYEQIDTFEPRDYNYQPVLEELQFESNNYYAQKLNKTYRH